MSALFHPSLVVHVFGPLAPVGEDRDSVRAHLTRTWDTAERLGADGPLRDGLPTALPPFPEREETAFRLLAGRSGTADGEIRQAYAFARHDVVGVSVALASAGEREPWSRWAALAESWRTAASHVGLGEPPPSILGEAMLFVAHLPRPDEGWAAIGPTVEAAVRDAGGGAWQPPDATPGDMGLWSWRDAGGRRILTVLSAPEEEMAVSRWLWWRDPREAPDFALYLLDASKLDYQARVHRARRDPLMGAVRSMDAELDEVLALHRRAGLSGRTSLPGLMEAQQRLIDAQASSAAAAIDMTHLRALRRTAGIAGRNLTRLAESSVGSGAMVRRDEELAAWLQEQVEHDLGYAEAAMTRSREAQQLTMLRLQQAGTQIARAQSRVTLLQTSLLGAMLAGLGAVAALRLTFEPPEPMRLPMLLGLMSLLLAAPALAAHWFERYTAVDHIAAMTLGGATGWIVTAALGVSGTPVLAIAGVVAGVAGARAATWLHDRVIVGRPTT